MTPGARVYSTGESPMPAAKKTTRPATVDLLLLQQEVNRLFERLSGLSRTERAVSGEWVPSVDVYECEGCVRVVVEVPGLQPESLRGHVP